MSTLVSVVIPCYNQAHFLAQAVQSALDQDYLAVEVIVVNDGSPDNTREVATQFGDRIVYIEQENRGLSAARNAGIRAARGEYIALLDSDDVCLPGRLRLEAEYLDAHPTVGAVFTDALLYQESRILGLKSALSGKPRQPQDFRWETVEYCPTPSTALVRRECFDSVGYFDERLQRAGEDWLFAVRLAVEYPIAYLDQPTIYYRLHGKNATAHLERINQQNRIASRAAVEWERFPEYPPHFRAKLLYYRFATAWRSEPRSVALGYFWQAVTTDPRQLPYGLRVLGQGLRNTLRRLTQS